MSENKPTLKEQLVQMVGPKTKGPSAEYLAAQAEYARLKRAVVDAELDLWKFELAPQLLKNAAARQYVLALPNNRLVGLSSNSRVASRDNLDYRTRQQYEYLVEQGLIVSVEWTHDGVGLSSWFQLVARW